MVDNDFNQITIDNKTYTKEICCDDIELIEKLKESGKLNPNLDNNEYIINCTNENKYVIDPIPIGEGCSNFVYNLIGQRDKVIRISSTLKLSNINRYNRNIIVDEIKGLFIQYYISKKCPYICKVYEFGYLTIGNEKHVYAILEKLIEYDLTGINFKETPQKYDYKIIMEQIFEGFLYILSNNYTHNDISLRNVGIGEDKNARIFDFETARHFYTTTSDLKYLKNKMEIPNNGSYEIEKYILTPNTLELINILATFYSDMGQSDKAVPLYEECLENIKQFLGNDHSETLCAMNNLARLYYRIGNMDKALSLIEECLEKCKQKIGNYTPDTLRIIDNIAGLYSDMGHRDKAVPLYEESLEKRKQLLGNHHHSTLYLMINLASLYQLMDEMDKSLTLFEEWLEITKQLLGNDHPDTLLVANNLACFYDDIGERDKAINLRKEYIL